MRRVGVSLRTPAIQNDTVMVVMLVMVVVMTNKLELFGCCRRETVSELLNHMFASDEVVDSVVTSGLFVMQTLLEYRRLG